MERTKIISVLMAYTSNKIILNNLAIYTCVLGNILSVEDMVASSSLTQDRGALVPILRGEGARHGDRL